MYCSYVCSVATSMYRIIATYVGMVQYAGVPTLPFPHSPDNPSRKSSNHTIFSLTDKEAVRVREPSAGKCSLLSLCWALQWCRRQERNHEQKQEGQAWLCRELFSVRYVPVLYGIIYVMFASYGTLVRTWCACLIFFSPFDVFCFLFFRENLIINISELLMYQRCGSKSGSARIQSF
jgi:hypothetical protein